ncbi:hypothetical protein EDC01DRAFT_81925 [Geopyxis carbonaria]|nr:hypothetical protein EDC01DRAFT_81925 [Geopyxis carbonaria]
MNIMRIKALVLKGAALSNIESDQSLPLQLYRAATRLPETFTDPVRNYPVFAQWNEKALANYAKVTYVCWQEEHAPPSTPTPVTAPSSPEGLHRDGEDGAVEDGNEEEINEGETVGMAIGKTIIDEPTVASAFRGFHNFVESLKTQRQDGSAISLRPPISEDAQAVSKEVERKEVYRLYFKFLSQLLLPSTHPDHPSTAHLAPSVNGTNGNTGLGIVNKGNGKKAGTREQLRAELRQIEHVYEEHLMRGLKFPKADEYHEIIGEWVDQIVENWRVSGGFGDDASPVVEILYRAAQKTFHSPRIVRHLFSTLTATGNFQDAMSALNTYFELVQKAKDRIAKGHHEKDFDVDSVIFQTAVEGVRVLCRFSGNGQKAMDIASKTEKWLDEWHITSKEILAEVYRGIGMANACWARQTPNGDERPGAQKMAVDAFKKGLTYDPTDVQGWYGLALVEAELRRTEDAIESARRGLGALKYHYVENQELEDVEGNTRDYKRWAVSLLHLLALLMTAKQDFEYAEKVCRNAFDIVGDSREAVSDLGVTDKVAVLELMITRLAITEAVEDSETAIHMAGKLLSLYGILFDGTHLIQRLEVGNSEDHVNGLGSSPSSRPGTTASRRSRIWGKSHKKQHSASYTSLPPPTDNDETPSRSGTLRKRPKSGHQSLGIPTGLPVQTSAPKIHVTDTNGGASSPSEKSNRKYMRPSSMSGGAIRRMASLGSMRSKAEIKRESSPTPPLPSSTEASSLNFGSPDKEHGGRDPHLFHMLKNKLHRHQLQQTPNSVSGSTTSVTLDTSLNEGVPESVSKRESTKVEDIPNNIPQNKLPFPLGAIGRTISDDGKAGQVRSSKRPVQLPEPKLGVDEERKMVRAGLRKTWLCVAGLYRRAGFAEDASMALEEANDLVDVDGEADIIAEGS